MGNSTAPKRAQSETQHLQRKVKKRAQSDAHRSNMPHKYSIQCDRMKEQSKSHSSEHHITKLKSASRSHPILTTRRDNNHRTEEKCAFLVMGFFRNATALKIITIQVEQIPHQISQACLNYYYQIIPIHHTVPINDFHFVHSMELSYFMRNKIDEKIINQLWSLIFDGEAVPEGFGKSKLLDVLTYTCIFYCSYKNRSHKRKNRKPPALNKFKLDRQMKPISEWISKEMLSDEQRVTKDEFTSIFQGWPMRFDVHPISTLV